MPLMMDDPSDQFMDGMDDMDDLFGESSEQVPYQIMDQPQKSLTTAPLIKGLPLRLDEMASTNCCQKIAWSRFGCVAAVNESGLGVDLYTFTRDPRKGTWSLSKPIPLPPLSEATNQVVHLMWSHMGNDLTVVDSSGRILIYSTGFALGQVMLVRRHTEDQDDDMSALVGLHWLPVFPHTQKSGIYWSATKTGDDWNCKMSQHLSPGPYNPVEGKSALICLAKSGVLRLMYQQRDGRWLETTTELEESGSAIESFFTHASFAPDNDNSLLVIVHQVSGSLKLFRININWNQPVDQKDRQQGQPSPRPSLDVSALLEEAACFPANIHSSDQDGTSNPSFNEPRSYQLTHLELVPVAPELGTREPTQATILAIFTILPSLKTQTETAQFQQPPSIDSQYQQATSVMSRWHLKKGLQDKLSSCYDQLSIKKKSTTAIAPRQRVRLERLPDILLDSVVLSCLSLRNSTMFAFGMSDGTVHFRYRDTMDIITADDNNTEVHTMPQNGFAFPRFDPALHLTFSPSACVIALVKPDGAVKLERLQYSLGSLNDILPDDARHGAIAATIALQHSSACMQYKNTDDLISIIPEKLNESMTNALLTNASQFLVASFDFVSDESQKQIPTLYRHHILYKCLSMQATLGSADKSGPRKLSARLAWITINLRLVSLNISMNLRSNENLRAEMAMSFVGLVKWSLDLFVYLLGEMFDLYFAIKHKEFEGVKESEKNQDWIHEYIRTKHSPALIVLLASIPRILLRMMCRPLRHGMIHSTNGFKTAINTDHKIAFSKLLHVYQNTPIAILPFETYVMEIDNLVKSAYRKSSISETARSATEREMFLTCSIPTVLMPVVTQMLTTKMDALMGQQDPGKVHNHDIKWLGLTDDSQTREFHKRHTVDVIRKLPLASNVRLRRCPRCASVMEDIAVQGSGASQQQQWVWQSQKTCICFNSWATPETKD